MINRTGGRAHAHQNHAPNFCAGGVARPRGSATCPQGQGYQLYPGSLFRRHKLRVFVTLLLFLQKMLNHPGCRADRRRQRHHFQMQLAQRTP